MSTQQYIFDSIKEIITGARNTDNEQIFKNLHLFRPEQDADQPRDKPHSYPYLTIEFERSERISDARYLQTITQPFVIRIHEMSLKYDKLEIYDAAECVLSLLNWADIKVSDTDAVTAFATNDGSIIKNETEIIYPISFEISYKSKQCPFTKVYPVADFDYFMRVTTLNETNIIPDEQDTYIDLSGTSGVVYLPDL